MTWFAGLIFLVSLAATVELAVGKRRLRRLGEAPLPGPEGLPRVSIVVAGRNEASKIEAAVRSMAGQDYPDLEVIVLDDRSTDGTGEILDRLARALPNLRVVHIAELPEGWLGKTHALHLGAEAAAGELLLFTDADVMMDPGAVRRAVGVLLREELDHLAAFPGLITNNAALRLAVGAFTMIFALHTRPWKVRDPKSPRHLGIGAFNLVRAEAYRAAGGHRAIAMRVDDDIKLGKLIKKHGYRQDALLALDLVQVEWYSTVGGMARGLMKNAFSGVEYRLSVLVLMTLAMAAIYLWPFVALACTGGPAWWFYLGAALLHCGSYWDSSRLVGVPWWQAVVFPAAILFFVGIVWTASVHTLLQGGITWRGTRYSLKELRDNRV